MVSNSKKHLHANADLEFIDKPRFSGIKRFTVDKTAFHCDMGRMQESDHDINMVVAQRARNQKLMGLDLGTKTIGIAFSDVTLSIATARETLIRSKFTKDAEMLLQMAEKENVFAFILGLPLNMDSSEGPRAQSTRAFARNLEKLSDLPIFFQDERLSTYAAEQAMLDADLSRRKRAQKIDAVAAAIILQGALDRLKQA